MKNSIKFLTCSTLLLSLSALAYESYVVQSPDEPAILMLDIPEEMRQEDEERTKEIKEKGYYHTYSENAAVMLKLESKKATARTEKGADPYNANLRLSSDEIKLTFPFVGIASVDEEHLLGFAPSGSAEGTTLDNAHWTGVTAYFLDDHFGACSLVVFDMQSLQGQAIYDSRYTTYDINGKPTSRSAEGSAESGFLYKTSWTGQRYEKMLECANSMPFDKQMLDDLVTYAKKIDNDLPDKP